MSLFYSLPNAGHISSDYSQFYIQHCSKKLLERFQKERSVCLSYDYQVRTIIKNSLVVLICTEDTKETGAHQALLVMAIAIEGSFDALRKTLGCIVVV